MLGGHHMFRNELYEIPYRTELCYQKNKGLILPEDLPYIGMGASYFATKVFRYLGINIYPENAAEYYSYQLKNRKMKKGVLISQSGHSSETNWCADHFSSFIGIVNDKDSPLVKHPNCTKQVYLHSGHEKYVPSKTYLNTLIVLYLGFGFDPREVLQLFKLNLNTYEQVGYEMGELIRKTRKGWRKRAMYVLGNGPNMATADLAALVLSEVLKTPVISMSASQYDHGFKETSKNVFVIVMNHEGAEFQRTEHLINVIKKAGAEVFELKEPCKNPIYSPLIYPMFFLFAAEYLNASLKNKSIFQVGDKVTRVDIKPKKDNK
jgi:glutamine---fructose-6-phosphate transaminase (isomerizing)